MVTLPAPGAGFQPGQVVANRFRVEALLGEGGMAAVYRACDERTGRKVALKLLRAPGDERRALVTSQFLREYHTLSQLAHPRIIEVFDYGLEQGIPYYTMELLDGEDLHERGRSGPVWRWHSAITPRCASTRPCARGSLRPRALRA